MEERQKSRPIPMLLMRRHLYKHQVEVMMDLFNTYSCLQASRGLRSSILLSSVVLNCFLNEVIKWQETF